MDTRSGGQVSRLLVLFVLDWGHHADGGVASFPVVALFEPAADGEQVSRKTVAKLMRSKGIVGISPRGWTPTTTVPDLGAPTIPDLVGRQFDQGLLNHVWTSDITYLPTKQGWLYLCAVRDGCSRRVLGWSVQDHLRADLVDQALTMAVVLRGTLPDKVIFHADRGTQGGFQGSSQHLDGGGVLGWDGGRVRRRYRQCRWAVGGSGLRIGRYGRRCVHRGGRSPRVLCSVGSGG